MTIITNEYIIHGHNYYVDKCVSTIKLSLLFSIF